MEEKDIKDGDIVTVRFQSEYFPARVISLPRGAGDLLQIQKLDSTTIMALNPYFSNFWGLEKEVR